MTAETINTVSPSTNKSIVERRGTSLEKAKEIIRTSQVAFTSWSQTLLAERKRLVRKAMDLLQESREKLGEELSIQMGRPVAYSVKEIETMEKRAAYLFDIAEEALGPVAGKEEKGFRRHIRKEAVGPALLVFAWNFPYLILVNSLVPALLAGNTVILKPSPQIPFVGDRIVEIFRAAGLPQGVVQQIQTGSFEVLDKVVADPGIKLITFTGSTAGGLHVRAAAANRLVPIGLELGGNDPAYVRDDADLTYVAAQLVDGAVFNSGQSCCAVERVYVDEKVHDDFVREVQKELAGYTLGNPLDRSTSVGPVVSRNAQRVINEHIQDAVEKGAINVTPENESFKNAPCEGNYVVPTVLINANHTMRVMTEETFGPVLPIQKVSSDEEAVKLMNDSDYGLTASIWTKDLARGEELLEKLDAGTVFVNRCDYPSPDLAWTGWKNSGLGYTLGPRGFDLFIKLKSFHVKEIQA
ncbi:betaine aldehyde dehydrogenase 2, partial [Aureobasidium melanogenum]